jgi:PAS domain S-box-containing protein
MPVKKAAPEENTGPARGERAKAPASRSRTASSPQSEALNTANCELRDKVAALEDANNDMAHFLASVDNATLFLGVNRTLQHFTPGATRLFNLSDADVGRPIDHITTRVDDPELSRDIERVLQCLAPCEREVSCDKGQWFLRRITPWRAEDDRVSGVMLMLTDITPIKQAELSLRKLTEHLEQGVAERTADLKAELKERQLAERALRASERKFRTLFNDAPIGIIQADPSNGCFLLVNQQFCRMTGYSEAELLGRPFTEITYPEDRRANLEEFLQLGRGEIPGFNVERRYVRKDGATLWSEVKVIMVRGANGQPLHALAVISDITERKLLQTKLDEHSAQLKRERNFIDAILNTVAALIVVIDREGRLVRFNAACNAMMGHDFAGLVGTADWLDLIPPDEMEGIRRVVDRLLAGEDHIVHENHWRHLDGSLRLLCWRNTALRDEAGQVQYIIATGLDITEQHQADVRARETLEDASRLQRLQTANELATLLAHELNQPLAAIASYAEAGQQLLRRAPLEQDKLTRNLDQISQQSLRAGEAIRHLRAFVGRGRIDPVPLDLNTVVRDTGILMVLKARSRGINLVLDLDETLPQVMGVGVHIEQVLLNLIRNAIDAIRDARMKSGRITVTTRREDGMARVSVCDSGPGIDAEHLEKVFAPLASRKEYGLGVGLRISRSLIEAHGGRLWVEPHQPGGIFHFVLPFAP